MQFTSCEGLRKYMHEHNGKRWLIYSRCDRYQFTASEHLFPLFPKKNAAITIKCKKKCSAEHVTSALHGINSIQISSSHELAVPKRKHRITFCDNCGCVPATVSHAHRVTFKLMRSTLARQSLRMKHTYTFFFSQTLNSEVRTPSCSVKILFYFEPIFS